MSIVHTVIRTRTVKKINALDHQQPLCPSFQTARRGAQKLNPLQLLQPSWAGLNVFVDKHAAVRHFDVRSNITHSLTRSSRGCSFAAPYGNNRGRIYATTIVVKPPRQSRGNLRASRIRIAFKTIDDAWRRLSTDQRNQ